MKKLVFLTILATTTLLAFKGDPIKVNPKYFGTYIQTEDTSKAKSWVLKANSDDSRIDFYMNEDAAPKFVVVMKDSTNFKTPREYSDTKNGVSRYWSARGAFLPDGKMELMVRNSDVSAGFKFTFSFQDDEKVVYTKK
jgi:hypothetical protein